jgi:formylglycine-generating enzyme required for sulfatase activity
MKKALWFVLGCCVVLALPVLGDCPSMDFTGDCRVDFADFAVFAEQWLTEGYIPVPVDMVPIPAGTFQMGNSTNASEGGSNELPVHTGTLSSFTMGKYEVTNGQYRDFLNSALAQGLISVSGGIVYASDDMANSAPYCDTSSYSTESQIAFSNNIFSVRTKGARDMSNDPMVRVSWYGSVAYCNWRSQQEGREECYNLSTWTCDFSRKGYRLATEAEWEYAARGGLVGKRFPWGDTITHSQANYYSSTNYSYDISPTRGSHPAWNEGIQPYTSPVGSFPANGYGLCDMAGNALEWCNDWYGLYSADSRSNPTGPTTGTYRVLRGGSWYGNANSCRVAYRYYYFPPHRSYFLGFRVVVLSD